MHRRVDDGLPGLDAASPLVLDLMDEDHRVADDHAGQRDDPEDGDEPHRRAGGEQDGGDPDEPERRHADDQGHLPEASELQHDHGEHERDHQRRLREDGGVALGALLHRAADLEQGPRRHRRAQLVERAGDLLMHEARLEAWQSARPER